MLIRVALLVLGFYTLFKVVTPWLKGLKHYSGSKTLFKKEMLTSLLNQTNYLKNGLVPYRPAGEMYDR